MLQMLNRALQHDKKNIHQKICLLHRGFNNGWITETAWKAENKRKEDKNKLGKIKLLILLARD